MCGGGGDASQAAQAAETRRQHQISRNVSSINSAYSGREPQYADFATALRERYGTELARKRDEASRQTKFSLARGGLTGGSAAIDAGRTLNRDAAEGTLAAERKAQSGVADLRSQDEASRLQMISLAQSGSDIGNAATQTANALRANIEGARANGLSAGLGDVFGETAKTYKAQQDAAAMRRGLRSANPYAPAFGAGTASGGGT